jgi:hypothetical protein
MITPSFKRKLFLTSAITLTGLSGYSQSVQAQVACTGVSVKGGVKSGQMAE